LLETKPDLKIPTATEMGRGRRKTAPNNVGSALTPLEDLKTALKEELHGR
jgi:hypothetical protein